MLQHVSILEFQRILAGTLLKKEFVFMDFLIFLDFFDFSGFLCIISV